MDVLAAQRPQLPLVIDPAVLTASVSSVSCAGETIEGPDATPGGDRCFYLDEQLGMAYALHSVNAMAGGSPASLTDFARHENSALASEESLSTEGTAARMLLEGVHVETVQGALEARGMLTHCFSYRPIANPPGLPALDAAQARFLDTHPTDRLLLQADWYEGDSASSHCVAVRREEGQWNLLDSG